MPTFLELSAQMVYEIETYTDHQFPRERPVELELWDYMKEKSVTNFSGRKTSMCRFGGPLASMRNFRGEWSSALFERGIPALELDWLKGRSFDQRLVLKPGPAEGIGEGATTAPAISIDDRSLKSCCADACVVSVMTLEETHNQRAMNLVVASSMPMEAIQSDVMANTKSVDGALDYRKRMYGKNGFMVYTTAFIEQLSDRKCLLDAGFAFSCEKYDPESVAGEIVVEDLFADMFGVLNLSFIRCRIRRKLDQFAWPAFFTRFYAAPTPADRANAMALFKTDLEIFRKVSGYTDMTPLETRAWRRSRFQTTPVEQLVQLSVRSNFIVSAEIERICKSRDAGAFGTLFIEDVNGVQKHYKTGKQGRRFKRPELLMARTFQSEVAAKRHSMSACLPQDAFVPSAKTRSMSYEQIASTASTPGWWSPSTYNVNTPDADLMVLRRWHQENNLRQWDHVWKGEVSHSKHKLALSFKTDPSGSGDAWEWFLCLDWFSSSGMTMWPADLHETGNGLQLLTPSKKVTEPCVRALTTLDPLVVQGACYDWRSPLWQERYVPESRGRWIPAVRAFLNRHGVLPVPKACSWMCWFGLSRTTLIPYCGELHVPLEPGADWFDVLFAMISTVLELDEAGTLDVMKWMLAKLKAHSHVDALCEIDEALNVLEKYDIEKVAQAKKEADARENERESFFASYHKRVAYLNH